MEHDLLHTDSEAKAYALASTLTLAKIPCHVRHIRTYEVGVYESNPPFSEVYAVVVNYSEDYRKALKIRDSEGVE